MTSSFHIHVAARVWKFHQALMTAQTSVCLLKVMTAQTTHLQTRVEYVNVHRYPVFIMYRTLCTFTISSDVGAS